MTEEQEDHAWAVIEALQKQLGDPFPASSALDALRHVAWVIINKTPDPNALATEWINELIRGKPH